MHVFEGMWCISVRAYVLFVIVLVAVHALRAYVHAHIYVCVYVDLMPVCKCVHFSFERSSSKSGIELIAVKKKKTERR